MDANEKEDIEYRHYQRTRDDRWKQYVVLSRVPPMKGYEIAEWTEHRGRFDSRDAAVAFIREALEEHDVAGPDDHPPELEYKVEEIYRWEPKRY